MTARGLVSLLGMPNQRAGFRVFMTVDRMREKRQGLYQPTDGAVGVESTSVNVSSTLCTNRAVQLSTPKERYGSLSIRKTKRLTPTPCTRNSQDNVVVTRSKLKPTLCSLHRDRSASVSLQHIPPPLIRMRAGPGGPIPVRYPPVGCV